MALLALAANTVFAQIICKGKVVDEQNEPIAGANVWVEYTTLATVTDKNGEFSLANIPEGAHELRAKANHYYAKHTTVDKSKEGIVLTLERSPLKLNEVVVTGTGTRNHLKNSPVAVDVYTKRDLDKVNASSFENAMLALNPSMSFTPNVMGSFMQLNGLQNSYILVLVDGKKLAGDASGNTDLSRINMSNVKRIEIQKGAASSLYGSEAIGGVINIITDKPKEKILAQSYSRYAKYGQWTQNLNADINLGKFTYSSSFQRIQTDGWQLSTEEINSKKDTVDTDKKAQNKFYSDQHSQKLGFSPVENFSVYVQGGIFDKKIQRSPASYDYDMLYNDYNYGGGAKYMINKKGAITLDYHHDVFEYTKVYIAKSGSYNIGDEEKGRTQKYDDMNIKGVYSMNKHNRFSAGVQYQRDYLESITDLKDGSRHAYTVSLYGQDELKLLNNKLQIVPGFRYVYHETFKNRFTPKLALMYSLSDFNFRAAYASGYKAPDLKKLYSSVESITKKTLSIPNMDLRPEISDYYSLGVEFNKDFLTASVSAYYNRLKDLITRKILSPIPSEYSDYNTVYQYQNSSKARIKGVDVTINSYIGCGLSIGAGYSFVDSYDYDAALPLEKISKHTGNFNANWNKRWWIVDSNICLTGRWQSRRYYKDGDSPAYNQWDLSTKHRIKNFKDFTIEPGIGIENIFDFVDRRPFGANYATISPGRTVFASLSIKFKK
jgi:outer membrane receptor for ferrienterochelin and colicins